MSVDFWCPRAPMLVERTRPYPEEEPDWWEAKPMEPFVEINMANGNAASFLHMLGFYGSDGGEWEGETLDRVYRKLMVLLNTREGTVLELETTVTPAGPGPRMVECGRDADYVRRRLSQLLQLVTAARQHGFEVVYG